MCSITCIKLILFAIVYTIFTVIKSLLQKISAWVQQKDFKTSAVGMIVLLDLIHSLMCIIRIVEENYPWYPLVD